MTTKPLRILHTESSCGWGGQEIRILTESTGMLARGHAVTLLSCSGSNIDRVARGNGVPAVALPIGRKRPGALLALRRWLAEHRHMFDVINTHSSTDAWLVAAAGATLGGMPPVVRTRHVSTAVNNGLGTRWLYLQATRHVVTTGERLRQQLHRDNGFALAHMTSIPTGIDLARYRPGEAGAARAALGLPGRPTLGIVATLRSWKGHADLLAAWAALGAQRGDWQLVVVGDGPQRANLEQQAAALGLQDAVHFVGNREDVERWLTAFDLFVLPSYGNEGVPQGIMQAMAAGLPVVSTTVGAIDEAVVDGETGVLLAPRDVAALGTTLARLMHDAPLRQRYGAAGLARAQARFGSERMLDAMEAVFRAALEPRG
ncbi:glycosyltransferase family 4 protein [Chitiniphilus purpureus]|uniref:Glycosyltransferase family 4 protein n=1 Tax=Chitiniphilus purpureus TaxID=2981137 RepID=A0ABY6DMJ4_9NEIS|nr:glycosyltransferase family 4 protein [Chitiniphilus sp. CD1]UXY15571.1 glycosyltransferase family 4 protein [Chitiniphilus sp. CD1]